MLRHYCSTYNFAEADNSKPLASARQLRGQFSDLALKQPIIFLSIRKHAAEPGMKLPRTRLLRNINGIGSIDPAAGKYKDAILRCDYKSCQLFDPGSCSGWPARGQNPPGTGRDDVFECGVQVNGIIERAMKCY